jgi:hypothetical protein
VPRDVELTREGRVLAILSAALIVAALGLGVWSVIFHIRQTRERDLRRQDAVLTNADVLDVRSTRDKHPRELVTYRFTAADGRSRVATVRLGRDEQRPSGGTIVVGYLRSNPDENWASGHEPDGIPVWVAPIVSVALATFAWIVIWRLRRDWTLLSEGRIAQGRVSTARRVAHQHHHVTRVTYEFTTLAGAAVQGRADLRRRPPTTGDAVTVVYHRDDPRWNALYPLSLVQSARK